MATKKNELLIEIQLSRRIVLSVGVFGEYFRTTNTVCQRIKFHFNCKCRNKLKSFSILRPTILLFVAPFSVVLKLVNSCLFLSSSVQQWL